MWMEEPLFVDHREPLEIDEASQRIRQRFAEKAKQHRDIHDTITAVYRAVWNDFYSWEPEGCRQIIDTLAVMSPGLSEVAFFENLFHPHPHSEDDVVVDESMSGLSITAFDLDHNYQLTLICTEHILPRFEPHPKYEACTPSARTIKSDEIYTSPAQGVELVHTLGFIQYAGELGFDERDYAMQYKAFAWQCNSCDSDCQFQAAIAYC
ncbi:hypothetical protein AcV5_002125 [Taiwanofungus camphoratus]|nr:hypothetical protein AcV5_002125 [Antrodia cinnamomea]